MRYFIVVDTSVLKYIWAGGASRRLELTHASKLYDWASIELDNC